MANLSSLRPRPVHAALYDRFCSAGERGELGRLRAELLAPLVGMVLEIGAGTGANLPHYRAGVRLMATEPDPHMLRRAAARTGSAVAGARLVQAAAEAIPAARHSLDAVVSTLVLCTVADPQAALTDIARVLRPGGCFVFLEHVRSDGWAGRLQDVIRPVWSCFAGGCTVNRRTEQAIVASGLLIDELAQGHLGGLPLIWGRAVNPEH